MKIASWNVNSIRTRLSHVTQWLEAEKPDVLLLQELKCQEADFPHLEIEALGYKTEVLGQKAYNGVAILSRHPIEDVIMVLPDEKSGQSRYLEATIQGIKIASVYAPNGNPLGTEKYDYKMDWMAKLNYYIKDLLITETPFMLGGDFNVIPTEMDVHDPAGWEADALFTPPTRAAWQEIINLGVTEAFRTLHPHDVAFSFWGYQGGAWQKDEGLRIDHFLLSPEMADRLESCRFDRTPRGWEKPSDHVPVIVGIL